MSIQIKGSRGYYSVDINNLTCTCKDFTCRRHHYPLEDPKRLCKHIKEAIELSKDNIISNSSTSLFDRCISNRYLPFIISELNENVNILKFKIAGEYRRELNDISELVIVCRVLYTTNIPSIKSFNLISCDDKEETYVTDCGLCIRIIKVNDNSYPFRVLSLTGSPNFIITMKSVALKFGLELNECGFKKDNNIIDTDIGNEEDIFEYLGLNYVEPKDRN